MVFRQTLVTTSGLGASDDENGASVAGERISFSRAASVLGFALIAALLAWGFTIGRNAQIAADAAKRAEIAQEDRMLCTDLGFEEPQGRYTRCLNGLAEIRRKQKERWNVPIP